MLFAIAQALLPAYSSIQIQNVNQWIFNEYCQRICTRTRQKWDIAIELFSF